MKWYVKKDENQMLLREYLRDVQGFSRRIVKGIKFQGGTLLVNGEFVTVRKVLKQGDLVEVSFPPEHHGMYLKPEPVPLHIIYEDDDVMVIDKDPNIATIPSNHHPTGTVANGILHHYAMHNINYTVHIVTRLDRDTSGLLLVAKHRLSHSVLADGQKRGDVARRYQAIIPGHMVIREGTIDQPIGRKPGSIVERIVDENGKPSITHYQVLEETAAYTLLHVALETGRTHQIRVHFAHLGHPLLGDKLYGGDTKLMKRQALHCVSLAFNHPITKERHTFTSSLPEDMKQIIQQEKS
ncbi:MULTISPECIES: RluA family pseudouridine synthase [Paraliobacillus]|uniref:RluA family pseudouridine synthase n=1 Tax=Paraliobacillus TaxID=200903 RepID=UPI001E4E3BF0|nr:MULTISPECIES: RluA family pseudouridine synthase [Paraliobacillus]